MSDTNLTKEELRDLVYKDNWDNISPENRKKVLNEAINEKKYKVVLRLIDEYAVDIDLNKNVVLHQAVRKRNCVTLLQGLDERGINIHQGLGLLAMCMFEDKVNTKNAQFLLESIDKNNPEHAYSFNIVLVNLINKFTSTNWKKLNDANNTVKYNDVHIKMMLPFVDNNDLNKALEKVKNESENFKREVNEWKKIVLNNTLKNELTQTNVKPKIIKI